MRKRWGDNLMLKMLIKLIVAVFFLTGAVGAAQAEELVVYTSLKASLMEKLKEDFERGHPGVTLSYESAGASKTMARLAAEREEGQCLADVLWTSEVPDFYALKSDGLLTPYTPKDIKMAINPFPDYDGSFTAVRLGTLGVAYNTDLIKTRPRPGRTWPARTTKTPSALPTRPCRARRT